MTDKKKKAAGTDWRKEASKASHKVVESSKSVYKYLEPRVKKACKAVNKTVHEQLDDKNSVTHKVSKKASDCCKSTLSFVKSKLGKTAENPVAKQKMTAKKAAPKKKPSETSE